MFKFSDSDIRFFSVFNFTKRPLGRGGLYPDMNI